MCHKVPIHIYWTNGNILTYMLLPKIYISMSFSAETHMSKYCHLFNRYGLGPYDTFFVLLSIVESKKLHVNISNNMAGMNFCSIKLLSTIGFISVYLIKINICYSQTNSQIIENYTSFRKEIF